MEEIEKFKQLFISEAIGLIGALEEILLDLEKNPQNIKRIDEIFRVIHILKGVGNICGYSGITELTHGLENIYDKILSNQATMSPEIIELTFSVMDYIPKLFDDAGVLECQNHLNYKEFMKKIKQLDDSIISVAKRHEHFNSPTQKVTFNIVFQPHDEIISRGINVLNSFKHLVEIGEIGSLKLISNCEGIERWSVFFVGNCSLQAVEEALMFIREYCTIEKIADFNLFDENEFKIHQSFINQSDDEKY